MIRIKKENLAIILILVMLLGAFSSGAGLYVWSKVTDQRILAAKDYSEYKNMKENYGKLMKLQTLIEKNYYTDVDEEKLYEGLYRGLFAGLDDPYSYYMNKEEYENFQIDTEGELSGVGVTVSADISGYIRVVAPIEDSPAEKAGIKAGDYIMEIDGESFSGTQLDEAVQKMRGTPGTEVTLTVVSDGTEKKYTLKRDNIVMQTVKSEVLNGKIGYIRVTSFEKNTADDFKKALRNLEVSGIQGLVVDLRNNPGGLVDSAVSIADMLLPAGVVAYTQNRNGEKEYYKTTGTGISLPYVLLVNEGSASASEILACAVQDNQGGALVGTKTFGKGIIQSISPLNDGSGGAVKLTVLQYFSPNGNVIHKNGVTPDHEVKLKEGTSFSDLTHETDPQLKKALSLLKK